MADSFLVRLAHPFPTARLPVIRLADGSWRGLTKGRAVEPEKVSPAFQPSTLKSARQLVLSLTLCAPMIWVIRATPTSAARSAPQHRTSLAH